MTRHFRPAAAMAALFTPLLALLLATPAAAQNDRRPVMAGRDTMLRAGPQAGYPPVRRIEQGQQMQLFGCLNDRSWCDVGYGDDRGWVSGPDLQSEYQGRRDNVPNLYDEFQMGDRDFRIGDYWDENYREQPFYDERNRWQQRYFDDYQPSWGPRPSQPCWGGGGDRGGRTTTGYMLRRAYLRAGPDVDYPRVGVIRARTRVMIHGCLRDWSWCDISDYRNRGWVFGQHITSTYRGRQRSVNSIAPYVGINVLRLNFGRYWDNNYRSQPFYDERDRWERQYVQQYRPTWGPGPERRYENQQWVPQRQQQPRYQPRMMPPGQQQQMQRQQQDAEQQVQERARIQQRAQQQAQARAQAEGQAQARVQQQAQEQAQARAQAQGQADARVQQQEQAQARAQAQGQANARAQQQAQQKAQARTQAQGEARERAKARQNQQTASARKQSNEQKPSDDRDRKTRPKGA